MAALSLSQELVSTTSNNLHLQLDAGELLAAEKQQKYKKKVTKREAVSSQQPTIPKSDLDPSSQQLLQLLVAMGFPANYIECALQELGGHTRPEQLVSWLLEHPDIKVCFAVKELVRFKQLY